MDKEGLRALLKRLNGLRLPPHRLAAARDLVKRDFSNLEMDASQFRINRRVIKNSKRRLHRLGWAGSLTSLENGSLSTSKSVVRWYRRISRSASVPGLYLCFFLGRGIGSPAVCIEMSVNASQLVNIPQLAHSRNLSHGAINGRSNRLNRTVGAYVVHSISSPRLPGDLEV
jgi:hypothetical protein